MDCCSFHCLCLWLCAISIASIRLDRASTYLLNSSVSGSSQPSLTVTLLAVLRQDNISYNNCLLVEEDNVGFPDFVGREAEDADAAVVRLVPPELVVVPHLVVFSIQHSTMLVQYVQYSKHFLPAATKRWIS